mmetsp:Transcript_21216/g.23030  ORF Transcript_21216/g.23030 Transcript_21216/m.23030 type:complete len:199 (+) Transcript_21216:29-625(+)
MTSSVNLFLVALYVLIILIHEGISWSIHFNRIEKNRSWSLKTSRIFNSGLSAEDYREGVIQFNQELSKGDELDPDDESFERELAESFFADLAKGKDTITVKDFLQWEELQDFVDMGVTTKVEILEMLKNVGVNSNSVTGEETVNFQQFYGTLKEVNELFMASELAVEAEKDLDFQRFMTELNFKDEGNEDEEELRTDG